MSIQIVLDNRPEFYTNLDVIAGRVVLRLSRPEVVGAIVVKLEGESRTALALPSGILGGVLDEEGLVAGANPGRGPPSAGAASNRQMLNENHKILYRVHQVFPDERQQGSAFPSDLQAGQHVFPFRFKVPFNNACSDPEALARIGGLAGPGGFANSPGLFGGIRVMDGSRQLMYRHVTKTLPPSFTGLPNEAEILYYVKVTVQRPGLFKANWRYEVGFKFLPIEPPRPRRSNQEAYARRPFTFTPPRTPSLFPGAAGGSSSSSKKRNSFFGKSPQASPAASPAALTPGGSGSKSSPLGDSAVALAPSYEMSARLPHPAILTCNQPIPLRLLAKKLNSAREQVYLVSLQIDLVGTTKVRCQGAGNKEMARWVVASHADLALPIGRPDDPPGTETSVPDSLWRHRGLPNTVMPSFVTCNLSRFYALEVKIGLSWGPPPAGNNNPYFKNMANGSPAKSRGAIFLPLHFSSVEVYSGIAPPPELLEAMGYTGQRPPRPPARLTAEQMRERLEADELYPPQLMPGETAGPGAARPGPPLPPSSSRPPPSGRPSGGPPPPSTAAAAAEPVPVAPPPEYDEAPPSYDEAMAEQLPPPPDRPAYSGETNENAPSSLPEKN